jgi:CheY-like chemotaxis protein/cold shock CspA family protein
MHLRVLINDDEPQLAELLGQRFEMAGFEVHLSHHCLDALRLAREIRPDVVVTDLRMPEMSGNELIRALEDWDDDLPVIAITGDPDTGAAIPADQARSVFLKPFNLGDLVGAARRHAEDRATRERLRRVARESEIPEEQLGMVLSFNAAAGWGLLKVPGQERPLYVNASDLVACRNPEGRFQFARLHAGQVVRFRAQASARGPRAADVEVIEEAPAPRS